MQASTPPVVDPVFATGQVWQVTWPEGDTTEATVPVRNMADRSGASYDEETEDPATGTRTITNFKYDPVDSDPEFILVARVNVARQTLPQPRICVVRTPGKVALGQTLTGAATRVPDDAMETYIKTGISVFLSCSMKRVK